MRFSAKSADLDYTDWRCDDSEETLEVKMERRWMSFLIEEKTREKGEDEGGETLTSAWLQLVTTAAEIQGAGTSLQIGSDLWPASQYGPTYLSRPSGCNLTNLAVPCLGWASLLLPHHHLLFLLLLLLSPVSLAPWGSHTTWVPLQYYNYTATPPPGQVSEPQHLWSWFMNIWSFNQLKINFSSSSNSFTQIN